MPENLTSAEFLRETWEDLKSPTTSNFLTKLSGCRSSVGSLEEMLDGDRSALTKMKKSVKALYNSGNLHVVNDAYIAESLERLSIGCKREQQEEVADAFFKFSVVTRELSALMKNLMQNLHNIVMFPLDSFLKTDLKGVKGDLKKPFDKASREYDSKFAKVEKEKKQLAKDAGMIKTDLTGAEVAEELEKERRMFQLQMCEYLIKVNDIRTKKGVELLHHLVEYYQAQSNYFQDGLKTIEHFRFYIDELMSQLSRLKQRQDAERKDLVELRESLRGYMTSSFNMNKDMSTSTTSPMTTSVYSLHQLQGNKAHGCEKSGYLLKKSESKMRKVWQRRRCVIKDGFLSISHSDPGKVPVKLNLLTCQVKLLHEDVGKKCFDLVSSSENRTYHFQADDAGDMEAWISVLNNAKESVLMKAFGEHAPTGASSAYSERIRELIQTILSSVRSLPGNHLCCDCSAPDPEWLSVNMGVLICLECCGVHREMGVHVSRTQSIVIDDLSTSQLLLARVVSNQNFNDIMEAALDPAMKPKPKSDMVQKKTFIRNKYENHQYAIITCTRLDDRRQDLKQAIYSNDILALLQVFAEGIDFSAPLPDMPNDENALHLAILNDESYSLYMIDFIIQNTNSQELSRRTSDGNTALHLCALHNRTESMKLLLRMNSDLVNYENLSGQTALHIACQNNFDLCIELLQSASQGKKEMFENVNIDWNLISDEPLHDFSDDDLDRCSTPERRCRSRPGSLVLHTEGALTPKMSNRSHTVDNVKIIPPPPPSKPKFLGDSGSLSKSSSGSTSSLFSVSSHKKQAPLPPADLMGPPMPGGHRALHRLTAHTRNPSDPGIENRALRLVTAADTPPPLPIKTKPPTHNAGTATHNPVMSSHNPVVSSPTSEARPSIAVVKPVISPKQGSSSSGQASATGSSVTMPSSSSQDLPTQHHVTSNQKKKRCVALYDCDADNDDELSFKTGDVIIIVSQELDEEEWWEGELESNPNKRGIFPSTFVKLEP